MSESRVVERFKPLRISLGRFTNDSREKRKLLRDAGLCAQCYELDFGQFSRPVAHPVVDGAHTKVLISLFDIINNHKAVECKFCSYLFEAIALERHDPLQHPAVKDHIPEELKGKNFEWWATHLSRFDKTSPFGHSRNKIIVEEDPAEPDLLRERRDVTVENAQQVGTFAGGAIVGSTASAASQGNPAQAGVLVAGSAGALFSSWENKCPVIVRVKLHKAGTIDAGLIEINLWGYGNRVNAPLARLSSFNLRIASHAIISDEAGRLVYGKTVGRKADLQGDCLQWLNNCLQHHGSPCEKPQWSTSLERPSGEHFRLIKIGERTPPHHDGGSRPEYACKIVSVGKRVLEYAALSYVWGETGAESLNLHVGNLARLSRRIDDEEQKVAQTISDAITVAKALGFEYLWVDSLCVIQQDGNNVDGRAARESQLAQMDRIFAHATVVLVAAAGHDANAGLVGVSSTREPDQTARNIADGVNVLFPLDYDLSYGKWDTRGWTLQEKLLSKRLLVFGDKYVSFHCPHAILREDMPAAQAGTSAGPPPIPRLSMPPEVPGCRKKENWNGAPVLLRSPYFSEYASLIEQYTGRNMTRTSDIIVGVSGLLRVLESMRHRQSTPGNTSGSRTLYGLPEEYLDLALLWQPPAVDKVFLANRVAHDLPSWSWAGWEINNNLPVLKQGHRQEALPGVRFEEAFWVSGNDDMSLRKFAAAGSDAEERYKPLVMWFRWLQERPALPWRQGHVPARTEPLGRLVPVNGCGLGIKFEGDEVFVRALERALKFRGLKLDEADFRAAEAPCVDGITLTDRHLVCETQRASFRLGRKYLREEPIWHIVDGIAKIQKTLEIWEVEIVDEERNVVGHVIPTDQRTIISTGQYEFILLSESQYWGNERRIDVVGYPLYNIMLVEWDSKGQFATRAGLGKIFKSVWDEAWKARRSKSRKSANNGLERVILR